MKTDFFSYQNGEWQGEHGQKDADLVLYFAAPSVLKSLDAKGYLEKHYPNAMFVGASTGGEILNEDVLDDSLVGTALAFEKSRIDVEKVPVEEDSAAVGRKLAQALMEKGDDLKVVYVVSDGLNVNGTTLVEGLLEVLPKGVQLTGGLAGDGADFKETFISLNGHVCSKHVMAVGFYGEDIVASSGSMGGWQPFGPVRNITKAEDNVLYELDGKPALALYKEYLGDEAKNLPGSALLYPLEVFAEGSEAKIVRTILAVDEDKQSMTFAGDVPQGYRAQLMSANFNDLADGALKSAKQARMDGANGDLCALLVSCIGRKLVMGQMVSDEAEAVADGLDNVAGMIGFYSYGEIAPDGFTGECKLHNQTMTITVIGER